MVLPLVSIGVLFDVKESVLATILVVADFSRADVVLNLEFVSCILVI